MVQPEDGQSASRRTGSDGFALSRVLATVILAGWLVTSVLAGADLAPKRLTAMLRLRTLGVPQRQLALLSPVVPSADRLAGLAEVLPPDAALFLVNARLEDYYLATYLLYPRRVLVDEPDRVIDGTQGQKVGRRLPATRLRALGITHLVIMDPARGSLRAQRLKGTDD